MVFSVNFYDGKLATCIHFSDPVGDRVEAFISAVVVQSRLGPEQSVPPITAHYGGLTTERTARHARVSSVTGGRGAGAPAAGRAIGSSRAAAASGRAGRAG